MQKHQLFCLSAIALSSLVLLSCSPTSSDSSTSEESQDNGVIRGKILSDNGNVVIAGIIVEDGNGKTFRTTTNALGAYNIPLAPGQYKITFTRGNEFSTIQKNITVEAMKKYYLQDVRLQQLSDSFSKGWVAGDLHQHTYYSDGSDSVESLALSDISQGLYYGFLSDHNVARGVPEWYNTKNLPVFEDSSGNQRFFNPFEAVEETTEFGHYQSIGQALTFDKYDMELYDSERYASDVKDITKKRIAYIAQTIRRAGALAQINHPYQVSTMGFNYWDLVDDFDTLEIWNGKFVPGDGRYEPSATISSGSVNYRAKLKWFELLNNGKYLPATGGTDMHDTTSPGQANGIAISDIKTIDDYGVYCQNVGEYSGVPTTYLNLGNDMTKESILAAIKNGHSFISNGPVTICTVNGKSYGEKIDIANGSEVTLNNDIFSRDGIEKIRIIKNGQKIKDIDLNVNSDTSFSNDITLEAVNEGDWIVIETFGRGNQYSITNPFFFD